MRRENSEVKGGSLGVTVDVERERGGCNEQEVVKRKDGGWGDVERMEGVEWSEGRKVG